MICFFCTEPSKSFVITNKFINHKINFSLFLTNF